MKTIIILAAISFSLGANAYDGQKWTTQEIKFEKNKLVTLSIKQKVEVDTCNRFSLEGKFKPLITENEAYILADFGVMQTVMACKGPIEKALESTGNVNLPNAKAGMKEFQTAKFRWIPQKGIDHAYILVPEGATAVIE